MPVAGARLALVAKLALAVGFVAAATLVILLQYLTNQSDGDYWDLIRSHATTRRQLQTSIWVAGLWLVGFAGIFTWFVALVFSFRIAGPLFRFSRNLEQAINNQGAPSPIRDSDALQEESRLVLAALSRVRGHNKTMNAMIGEALAKPQTPTPEEIAELIDKLERAESNVRL